MFEWAYRKTVFWLYPLKHTLFAGLVAAVALLQCRYGRLAVSRAAIALQIALVLCYLYVCNKLLLTGSLENASGALRIAVWLLLSFAGYEYTRAAKWYLDVVRGR